MVLTRGGFRRYDRPDGRVAISATAIDPATLTLPGKMKLNTNVSTLPVIRQLTALAIDRG
jgi:hypothetical protein